MKTNTLITIIIVIAVIAIAVTIYNRTIRVKNAPDLPAPKLDARQFGGGYGGVCSPDSYICGITSGGTVRCCPIPPNFDKINPYTIAPSKSLNRDIVPVSPTCPAPKFKCSKMPDGTYGGNPNGDMCCISTASGRILPVITKLNVISHINPVNGGNSNGNPALNG